MAATAAAGGGRGKWLEKCLQSHTDRPTDRLRTSRVWKRRKESLIPFSLLRPSPTFGRRSKAIWRPPGCCLSGFSRKIRRILISILQSSIVRDISDLKWGQQTGMGNASDKCCLAGAATSNPLTRQAEREKKESPPPSPSLSKRHRTSPPPPLYILICRRAPRRSCGWWYPSLHPLKSGEGASD